MPTPKNREIRGWALRVIGGYLPYGASFRVLEAELEELGLACPETELKGHLKYLLDKGYITLEEIERHTIMRRVNHITPKGIDLLEGNISADPGVMLVG